MKTYKTAIKYLFYILGGLVTAACTKTEYEPTKLPYNDIMRFAVKGFVEGDTLIGVVSDNEIQVYWDQAVPLPQSVQPVIVLSEGAVVSPASGEAVSLTDNTVYTVTAQDGSEQKYTLKFILQQPSPIVLSAPNAPHLRWKGSTAMAITGQYFLAAGDTSSIRVFARRATDGVEFDLPLDHQHTRSTYLIAFLPPFTAEADTGRHDIKLTIGQRTIDVAQGRIQAPYLQQAFFKPEAELVSLSAGQELSFLIDDQEEGRIFRFYKTRFTQASIIISDAEEKDIQYFDISEIEVTDSHFKFKVPDAIKQFAGYKVLNLRFRFNDSYNWQGFDEMWYAFDNPIQVK